MLDKKTKTAVAKSLAQKGKRILNLLRARSTEGCELTADLNSSISLGESKDSSFSSDFFTIEPEINSRRQRGQVVLEYVLLLAMGVIIGALIMKNFLGSADDPKGLRKAWACLLEAIGNDQPGKPGSSGKKSSLCN